MEDKEKYISLNKRLNKNEILMKEKYILLNDTLNEQFENINIEKEELKTK